LPEEERDPVVQKRKARAMLAMLGAQAWAGELEAPRG